jgi:hypothetical protein
VPNNARSDPMTSASFSGDHVVKRDSELKVFAVLINPVDVRKSAIRVDVPAAAGAPFCFDFAILGACRILDH